LRIVPMGESLRDQLLKAGLVSKTKAAEVERQESRARHRQAKSGAKPAGEGSRQRPVSTVQAAKAAKDRELNQKRQSRLEARARSAEVRQLIEQHALPRPEGEEYYNFVAGRKIRRIAVDAALLEQLARGTVFIVRHEGRNALVPAEIAERIRERDEHAVIPFGDGSEAAPADEDDPYKDFVVPDDLRW